MADDDGRPTMAEVLDSLRGTGAEGRLASGSGICTCGRPLAGLGDALWSCRSCGKRWREEPEGGNGWMTLVRDPLATPWTPPRTPDAEPVTFDEVAAALTPRLAPGVSRADLFAALKGARVTGGHQPGRPAPDIGIGGALKSAFADAIAAQGPRCPGCGAPDGIPHHERCSARQEGDAYIPLPADELARVPLAGPEDPFPGDLMAGTGIAEMLKAMTAGGVPPGSAERIIGAMLAAHGIMSKEADDA